MLALNELFRKVLRSSRKKVLKFFIECLGPRSDDVILDLGAAGDYCGEQPFFEDNYRWKKNIIGVNVNIDELASLKRKYKEIPLILADGCCLPFKTKSIDILFSNAVIEHVGDLERQKKLSCSRGIIRKISMPRQMSSMWKSPCLAGSPSLETT